MKKSERIWDYLRGNRMGKEANRLEREALSDPFLYEALQGLEKVEGDHKKSLAGLFMRMQKTGGEKKTFRLFYRLSLVAACLLIAGWALWLLYVPEAPVRMAQITSLADSTGQKTETGIVEPEFAEAEQAVKIAEKSFVRKRIADVQGEKAGGAGIVAEQESEEAGKKNDEPVPYATAPISMSDKCNKSEKWIEGIVTDAKGQPLPGASISLRDNKPRGSSSDRHGYFMLSVPDSTRQLQVSFVGMKSEVFNIPDSGKVHVTMTEFPEGLCETRITGYRNFAGRMEKGKKPKAVEIGRQSEFNQYVADSLRYPEDARLRGIEGKVVLSVHLNRRRHSMRIKVVDKLFPSCDREAIRLVEDFNGDWGTESRDFKVTVRFQLSPSIQH